MIREWMLWLQDALGHEMRMDARDMQRAELRMLPTPGKHLARRPHFVHVNITQATTTMFS